MHLSVSVLREASSRAAASSPCSAAHDSPARRGALQASPQQLAAHTAALTRCGSRPAQTWVPAWYPFCSFQAGGTSQLVDLPARAMQVQCDAPGSAQQPLAAARALRAGGYAALCPGPALKRSPCSCHLVRVALAGGAGGTVEGACCTANPAHCTLQANCFIPEAAQGLSSVGDGAQQPGLGLCKGMHPGPSVRSVQL